MDIEQRLRNENNYCFIKHIIRKNIGMYKPQCEKSGNFYNLADTSKDEILNDLKEEYNNIKNRFNF